MKTDLIEDLARLSILRHQFERQMLHVRETRGIKCNCSQKPGLGRRDPSRTDKSCDLCGPFIASMHRARTELDRKIARHLSDVGFSPERKVEEHITKYLEKCVETIGTDKELFHNV